MAGSERDLIWRTEMEIERQGWVDLRGSSLSCTVSDILRTMLDVNLMLQLWEAGSGVLVSIPSKMLSGPRRIVQEFEATGTSFSSPDLYTAWGVTEMTITSISAYYVLGIYIPNLSTIW